MPGTSSVATPTPVMTALIRSRMVEIPQGIMTRPVVPPTVPTLQVTVPQQMPQLMLMTAADSLPTPASTAQCSSCWWTAQYCCRGDRLADFTSPQSHELTCEPAP